MDVKGESALTGDEALEDQARVDYLQDYLSEVGKAIRCFDKVDVRGYFVWSFLDNFEWAEGYARLWDRSRGLHLARQDACTQ